MTSILDTNSNKPALVSVALVKFLGWLLAMFLGAAAAWTATQTRLSVLEAKQGAADQRLDRIEQKIDVLLQRR